MIKAAEELFADEGERRSFLSALKAGDAREQAIIVLEAKPEIRTFPRLGPAPFQPDWVIRIADHFRAAKHRLYEKGAYYSLDFSSVFSASAMLAIPDAPRRVLDLCASPGGKAIFAWRAFRPEILACNESVRKRLTTLMQNLTRCQVESAQTWSADSSVWAKKTPESFDLTIVDAPCSGQSLLAKGDDAPGAFDPAMIDMNVGRQRRIVGNASRTVRAGGHLLYATCTFSKKENEKVLEWLMRTYPAFVPVEVPKLSKFRSAYVDFPCYRLFPHQSLGAGAFVALLRRAGDPTVAPVTEDEIPRSWRYGEPLTKAVPRVMTEEEEEADDAAAWEL